MGSTLYTLGSKFEFSFVSPIHFLQKLWGEVDKTASKFIRCNHARNSHYYSVLQSTDITRRNLMPITLRAKRVKDLSVACTAGIGFKGGRGFGLTRPQSSLIISIWRGRLERAL